MNFNSVLNRSRSQPHQRTIIHLDMDYFYAQVEEIREPTLRPQPVGVNQKNMVVTCNYIAREFGVKKLMSVSEAKELCPSLVLVNGEDLTPYRQVSQKIFEILLNYTPTVEKLGFDEDYMDVSALVEERLKQLQQKAKPQMDANEACMSIGDMMHDTIVDAEVDYDEICEQMPEIVGNIYPKEGAELLACQCGCARRLAIGTQIAKEIRNELYLRLGITCSAGISYNKLLAKLVGSQNKPNQQTVLVSTFAEQFMRDLKDLHSITGIGQKTETVLLENCIANIEELQKCDMECLRKKLGFETATKLKDLSFGRDTSAVRTTGKPKSIGLEDSCRPISVQKDVEERFRLLLMRLMEQVAEDGRIPITLKVILRKFDPQKKTSHRETKQANILPSLFKAIPSSDAVGMKVMLVEGAQDKLLKIIMRLFERIVDLTKPFNITLIGLAFSKFQQRKSGSSSIANFLIKKTDLEVQSITSLTNTIGIKITSTATTMSTAPQASTSTSLLTLQNRNHEVFRSSPTSFQPSDQFYRRRATAASPLSMLTDNGSESGATNSDFSDFSETEVEPSPKKSRIGHLLAAKRRCMGSAAVCNTDSADVASPSKLRVCDLRLNSRDSEKDVQMHSAANSAEALTNLPNSSSMSTSTQLGSLQRHRTIQPPTSLLKLTELNDNCNLTVSVARQISIASSTNSNSPLPSPMDESCSIVSSTSPPLKIPLTIKMSTYCENDNGVPNANTNAHTFAPDCSSYASTDCAVVSINPPSNMPCPIPASVDPSVFNALPIDVRNELITSWRRSFASAAANSLTGTTVQSTAVVSVAAATSSSPPSSACVNIQQQAVSKTSSKAKAAANSSKSGPSNNVSQKNTLYRYFLRNK